VIDPSSKIHRAALVDEGATIGPRTRVWAFVHVLTGARVGADCNLCDGVYVENEVVLGDRVTVKNGVALYDRVTVEDDVFIGPNAAFTNDLVPRSGPHRSSPADFLPTILRRGATVGANATIVCGTEIGAYSFVAAGAVVTRSVPSHGVVRGNPARLTGFMCKCGKAIPEPLRCECGIAYGRAGDGLVAVEGNQGH
jgi:UDP-2-acetamido-3-amino-2,3-dideoxy-glucuronate N-acetyltransferase